MMACTELPDTTSENVFCELQALPTSHHPANLERFLFSHEVWGDALSAHILSLPSWRTKAVVLVAVLSAFSFS